MRVIILFCMSAVLLFTSCQKEDLYMVQPEVSMSLSEFANLNITVLLATDEHGQSCETPGDYVVSIERATVSLLETAQPDVDNMIVTDARQTDKFGVVSFSDLTPAGYLVRVESSFGMLERTIVLHLGETKNTKFLF